VKVNFVEGLEPVDHLSLEDASVHIGLNFIYQVFLISIQVVQDAPIENAIEYEGFYQFGALLG
jgi:hypothetical protein